LILVRRSEAIYLVRIQDERPFLHARGNRAEAFPEPAGAW